MPDASEISPDTQMVYSFQLEDMRRFVDYLLRYVDEMEIIRTRYDSIQLCLEYSNNQGFVDIIGPTFSVVLSRLPLKENDCFYSGSEKEAVIAAAIARFVMTDSMSKLHILKISYQDFTLIEHTGVPHWYPLRFRYFPETELNPWRQPQREE